MQKSTTVENQYLPDGAEFEFEVRMAASRARTLPTECQKRNGKQVALDFPHRHTEISFRGPSYIHEP